VTLAMIESKDEQKFIINLLNEVMGNNDSVWVKLSKEVSEINNLFEVKLRNWMKGKALNLNISVCVILKSISLSNVSESEDTLYEFLEEVLCGNKNLVLCQKIQSPTSSQMQNAMNEMKVKMNKFNDNIGIEAIIELKNSNNFNYFIFMTKSSNGVSIISFERNAKFDFISNAK
jgi:hypothetical protein